MPDLSGLNTPILKKYKPAGRQLVKRYCSQKMATLQQQPKYRLITGSLVSPYSYTQKKPGISGLSGKLPAMSYFVGKRLHHLVAFIHALTV
jgi:hypothetical protein